MGIFKKTKETARETSKKISEGIKETQHLGKYTAEMINQELFSLRNTKPAFRNSDWVKRSSKLEQEIRKKLSRNERSILCQVWLRDLEGLRNVR